MIKVFIIAGEASGDYLGSCLMNDMKSLRSDVEFIGVGGERMEKSGLQTIFSINELSIIGVWEVVRKIFYVKKLIDKTVEAIFSYKPDVIVSIDSSGFTHRVDKIVKKRIHENAMQNIPVIHYAAPPVWAWRSWRAKSLSKFIDKLLVLLPFEPELFQKYGPKTVFVGHPVAKDEALERPLSNETSQFLRRLHISSGRDDKFSRISVNLCSEIPALSAQKSDPNSDSNSDPNSDSVSNIVRENYPRRSEVKIITLLPGSRKSEIDAHVPILGEFCNLMLREYKNVKFIIPTISAMKDYLAEKVSNWDCKPIVTDSVQEKVLAYYASDAAVAASGTVVLELARAGVPAVVIYKTSAITSAIVRMLIHVKFVSLVNIISNQEVVPELLQEKCTAKNIFQKMKELLREENSFNQKETYRKVIEALTVEDKLAANEVIKSAEAAKDAAKDAAESAAKLSADVSDKSQVL